MALLPVRPKLTLAPSLSEALNVPVVLLNVLIATVSLSVMAPGVASTGASLAPVTHHVHRIVYI